MVGSQVDLLCVVTPEVWRGLLAIRIRRRECSGDSPPSGRSTAGSINAGIVNNSYSVTSEFNGRRATNSTPRSGDVPEILNVEIDFSLKAGKSL